MITVNSLITIDLPAPMSGIFISAIKTWGNGGNGGGNGVRR